MTLFLINIIVNPADGMPSSDVYSTACLSAYLVRLTGCIHPSLPTCANRFGPRLFSRYRPRFTCLSYTACRHLIPTYTLHSSTLQRCSFSCLSLWLCLWSAWLWCPSLGGMYGLPNSGRGLGFYILEGGGPMSGSAVDIGISKKRLSGTRLCGACGKANGLSSLWIL